MKMKFYYILNIIHYILYLFFIKFDILFAVPIYYSFYVLLKYCLPKKINVKYIDRLNEANETGSKIFRDPKDGSCIGWANTFFGMLYCNFFMIPIGILVGLITKLFGMPHPVIYMGVVIMVIAFGWRTPRKAVFDNDRYLKYFKKFEKESKQWHRKWALITVAFCFCSLLSAAFGIYLCFACAIGRFDLWNLMARG